MDGDKYTKGLIGKLLSKCVELITTNPSNTWMILRIIFAIITFAAVLFLIIGTEPLKIILRRNIGRSVSGILSMLIAIVVYGLWAQHLYSMALQALQTSPDDGYCLVLLAGTIFYISLSIGILTLLVIETVDTADIEQNPFYRGESFFFKFLKKRGISQQVMWVYIEPITCILISLVIFGANKIVGLPILVTSVSFFANEFFEVYTGSQNAVLGSQGVEEFRKF